ncbi:unnamed protein product [Microthlaspi erraticum]|uniref:Uncharacterized protein n=1 Tax=Microthlaspi erraticum TaxID=1685480 RepID=A0A6D2HQG4_9BRAS|nr:unnamed protein product [Microthlaspi erraticum]
MEEDLGVAEKFVSNKDDKPISHRNLCESEPPDIGDWFSSYIYESPVLDTSDCFELSSIPEERERVKETQTEEETTTITDFTQSQSLLLSEPPHVRNWFSSYEYQSPQLTELDELIIDESDTEEENACGIFRKTKSKQETTIAKEVSSDSAYSDQEMEKKISFGSMKQESSFKQDPLFCEPRFNPRYKPKQQSLSTHEASLQELGPKHIQETNPSRQNSPKACLEENLESVEKVSDDKENVEEKSTGNGFVTMKKKTRFRESRDYQMKPNRGVMVEGWRSRELKMIDREEDEERKRKRRVLGEMSNLQFSGAEEIAGKWRCPQKNKVKSGPPLKQLRLDAWIHKV